MTFCNYLTFGIVLLDLVNNILRNNLKSPTKSIPTICQYFEFAGSRPIIEYRPKKKTATGCQPFDKLTRNKREFISYKFWYHLTREIDTVNRKWFKDLINLFASNQPSARTPASETINKMNNIENDIDGIIISRATFPTFLYIIFQHCRIN